MARIFQIFFNAEGTRPALVLICLILAGFASAIGLTSLLPMLTELAGGAQENSSPLNRYVIDTLAWAGIEATIANLLIIVVAVLAIRAVLSFAALTYVGYSVASVATLLRERLAGHLLDVRWQFFAQQRVGRIANALSNDATRAGKAYLSAARFVAYVIEGIVYVVVATLISWQLALAGLGAGALMAATLSGFTRMSRRAGYRQTDRTSDLVKYVTDALNNIKPLKTMDRTAPFVAMFTKKLNALKRALRLQVIARNGMTYGRELALFSTLGIGLYITAVMWQIPLPELLVMGIVFYNVVNVVGKTQLYLQHAVELESAHERIRALIEQSAGEAEINPGTRDATLDDECRFENVTFAHEEASVVRDVDIVIPAGEVTVLRGPSGAGKTTLIDLLTGLYQPDAGRILVDGVALEEIDLRQWRQLIGYVPQDLTLFHDTIAVNISLGDDGIGEDAIWRALALADAKSFVEALPDGLDTIVGERGTRLSGGERQRISLARALVTDPKLLILDEVTSALDPDTEKAICDNVARLSGSYTIVVITHRPIWAEIADTVYLVDNGTARQVDAKTPARETA